MKLAYVIAISAALLAPPPAIACSSPDLGPEIYCGTYRGGVKTSFYKTGDGRIAPFEPFDDLRDFLDALPPDREMRDLAVWRPVGPEFRLPEEEGNVAVMGYIVAVKPEDDHDFHVIISNRPRGARRVYMTVEVSGLPRNRVDEGDLARAREELRAAIPEADEGNGRYIKIDPPVRVLIQGSLFFDGDHGAGCQSCPGPAFAKPKTVWEIHPVYSITPQ